MIKGHQIEITVRHLRAEEVAIDLVYDLEQDLQVLLLIIIDLQIEALGRVQDLQEAVALDQAWDLQEVVQEVQVQ